MSDEPEATQMPQPKYQAEQSYPGLPVSGYKPQSLVTIAIVNANKQLEEMVLRQIDGLNPNPYIDSRWLAIGRTHLEIAFMAINRAVFQPGRIKLNTEEVKNEQSPT